MLELLLPTHVQFPVSTWEFEGSTVRLDGTFDVWTSPVEENVYIHGI